MNQSSEEERKYGRCIRCNQSSTSIICQTCDSNLKERECGKCISCKQIKPINKGERKVCHTCDLAFKERKFGKCIECKQVNTGLNWCQTCNSKRFQQDFNNWTSNNSDIDKFIQNNQLSAKNEHQLLEWIPYDRFYDIEYIAKGGFGKVYKATWKDSNISHWDANEHRWKRHNRHNKYVVLKSLHDSQNITLEFINEDKPLYQFIKCYGINQDPSTKNYIMVMQYADNGSVRDYFNNRDSRKRSKSRSNFTFDFKLRHKIIVLDNIISGLKRIHVKGLVHRDLHIGNIVCFKSAICITDMGLCKPVNYKELENAENNVYGVLPYIAPEILRGQDYTQASDIYSFGIIMYEIISESPPYYGIAQDEFLALSICEGLKLKFNIKVPQLILDLIKKCLDANPSDRPNVKDLSRIFYEWIKELNTYLNSIENRTESIKTEIVKQIEETEKMNIRLSSANKLPSNKNIEPIISKLLNFNNLPRPWLL
ncbi:kinase-like domain-containing protein [Rhizophagus clarus]|uniref:Kinase-like domain-containing protein n=2 Tax=Rhizophagus clarus TaxID=94130 RepID=A0A8H3KTN1_9GLOM|nr:kinase-like domain-containing protein [Rhizophagus clarus]